MPEEINLTPHPYQHDAWFMLGYLRQCIAKTGGISTTDWLKALDLSRIPNEEERLMRQIAQEVTREVLGPDHDYEPDLEDERYRGKPHCRICGQAKH